MNFNPDSRKPNLDLVMHVGLATIFCAATLAFVVWPEVQYFMG